MAEGEETDPDMKRSSSYGLIPPYMSEVKVILLGNSLSLKISVGNLLLNQTVLNAECETQTIQSFTGEMNGRPLTLVKSPDLQYLYKENVIQTIKTLGGPRVFLLLLQPEDFTEEHKGKLHSFLQSLGEHVFDQTLLLILMPQGGRAFIPFKKSKNALHILDQNPHLRDLIISCKYRYIQMNYPEEDVKQKEFKREELCARISQMWSENTDDDVTSGASQEVDRETKHKSLNLVLCGSEGKEKTSVIESIFGPGCSRSSPERCTMYQTTLDKYRVSLVELPSLSDKPPSEMMELGLSCLSLCGPQGIHAFLHVLPKGPLTDEDKAELKTLKTTFSSAVLPFTKVLVTVDSDPNGPDFVDRDLQGLCQTYARGYVTFNTRGDQQGCKLLKFVETLKAKNKPQSYTTATLIRGQRRMIMDQTGGRIVSDLDAAADSLRIALIGKTGCGKSSSGNTILGYPKFFAEVSQDSVTQTCEKAETVIDDRQVIVVDTPGLFDNSLSNESVMEEMSKCVSLLAPGPHVFLLVIAIGRMTKEEQKTVELLKDWLGEESQKYTMVLFTRGDELEGGNAIEHYIQRGKSFLKKLLKDCEDRYHVFNNKNPDRAQVKELLKKIDAMVQKNGGGCFTNDMFQNAAATIKREMERILMEKEEEMRREMEEMETKHQQELEEVKQNMEKQKEQVENERKQREQQLREIEEKIKEEEKLRKEEQVKREEEQKQEEDEKQREWAQKLKDLEEKIKSETASKEAIDQKLQESREKMEEERQKREKERNEWWGEQSKKDKDKQQELRHMKNECEKIKKEVEDKKQEEERLRKEQEALKTQHKKALEELEKQYEAKAKEEAEKKYQQIEKENMEENKKRMYNLVACICKNPDNVTKIKEKLEEHEKQLSEEKDEEKKKNLPKAQQEDLVKLVREIAGENSWWNIFSWNKPWCTIL